MSNDLTNQLPPITVAQVRNIVEGKLFEPPANVARQLLATMQENDRLREALTWYARYDGNRGRVARETLG